MVRHKKQIVLDKGYYLFFAYIRYLYRYMTDTKIQNKILEDDIMEFKDINDFCECMEQQTEIEEFRFIGAMTSSIVAMVNSNPLWKDTLTPIINEAYNMLIDEIKPLFDNDSLSQEEIDFVVKAYYRIMIDVLTSYVE